MVLVLKLLKMAKGIRALLDTVMQALPQVGNLGLLFFLLFFIFAALGVEMFGRLGKYLNIHTYSLLTLLMYLNYNASRGKSLLELWVTIFLPDSHP